jgi:uncharacterized protein YbbK (DUF523 family)
VNDKQDRTLRLGVSACLLGHEVRYDGGHKRHPFLTDLLAPFVDWVPVCPEVEAGFGTPREAMHLVNEARGVLDVDGYVLKKDSPSCGLFRVNVYGRSGIAARTGRGLFAAGCLRGGRLQAAQRSGRERVQVGRVQVRRRDHVESRD